MATTDSVSVLLVAAAKFTSPKYDVVMVCDPDDSDDELKLARPLASVALPSTVVPSRKFTVPEGVPTDELTFAVKVTVLPCTMELLLVLSATVGVTCAMVKFTSTGVAAP
jgi:hypothetical protein